MWTLNIFLLNIYIITFRYRDVIVFKFLYVLMTNFIILVLFMSIMCRLISFIRQVPNHAVSDLGQDLVFGLIILLCMLHIILILLS